LRFAQTGEDDQLATISLDGKGSFWLASVDFSKDPDIISKEEDSKLPSNDNDIVRDLQHQVITEDDGLIKIPEVTGGNWIFLHQVRNLLLLLC
jgi:hypothetical protein